ncbi:hypothetical protein LTS10_012168 [Elasticomyces elasticus]|nr:hypothetical protein LTS10_012168 [Elasticomyces elasticus]
MFAAKQGRPQDTLDPDALQLKQDLQMKTADPVATLRERIQLGTTDIQTARVCLEVCFARLKRLRRKDRLEQVKRDSIGRLTLEWLWSEDRCWVGAVLRDTDICEKFVYFVVAEGLQDVLLRWIEHPLPPVESLTERVPHAWRGQILRQMIWAHLVLELEGRADVAITVFFDTYRRVKAERRRDHGSALSSISLWPAEVEIAKTLLTGYYPNTDPKLYEQFMCHFASQHKTTAYSIAQLALQHPQKPDPGPAFACIMERLMGLTAMEYQQLFPPKTSTGKSMYFVARRAEDLLREQGKVKEAEQIETLLQRLVSNEERRFLDDAVSRDKELKRELQSGWTRRSAEDLWRTGPRDATNPTTPK